MQTRIAVLEADPAVLEMIASLLEDSGYHAMCWELDTEPWGFIHQTQPDLVILDTWLRQRREGVDLIRRLGQEATTAHIPLIVCASDLYLLNEYTALLEARRCIVVTKPFDVAHLVTAIEAALTNVITPE